MFIVCLFFVFCFLSFFLTCLFFSPTRLKDTNPDSTEDSIPDSNLYFSWLFSNVQQISQVLPSKSAFCSKVFFFLYVDLLIFLCLCFCESSVESLFSSCFYGVSFFLNWFLCSVVLWDCCFLSLFFCFWFVSLILEFCEDFFSQHCVVFIGI